MRQLYSEEAEQAILGACFLDNTVAQKVVEWVWDADFYIPVHREIFAVIKEVVSNNVVSDVITVSDKAGHFDYCIDLARNTPSTANVNAYIAIVKDYTKERELYAVGQLINDELLFNEDAKTSDRVQRIEAAFTALSTERVSSTVFTIKDAVKDLLAHMEWQNDNPDHKGVTSGLKSYDERIGGYNGGEMIVIAGTPGSGKTTMAMQVARQACTDNKRVMVFSLEMPKRQLAQRMMSASHSIPLKAFKDGSAYQSPEYSVKLAPAASMTAKMDMVIDDQGGIDILDLKSRARIAHREKKLDLILIDYLQLLNDRRHKDRLQVVSSVSREIKALAKELDVPIIALSQLNRSIMNRTDKRPQLSDLRESGQIEQDADIITFLFREYLFDDRCDNPNGVELITRKFRDGETDTDYVEFEGMFNRFINTQWRPVEEPEKKSGRFKL